MNIDGSHSSISTDASHEAKKSLEEMSREELQSEILRLREENNRLEQTVSWMHDMIWQMVRERKQIKEDDAK